jgi:Transport and Golgi organisation 2
MCTVTYIPSSDGYYLVSNRDEKHTRKKALLPLEYYLEGTAVIFPKDADAGGTWIILKENGDSLCLLNGAFTNFADAGQYTVSRGKIVLEIAAAFDMQKAFQLLSLTETAPFTLIMINNARLWECRWDGEKKYCKLLDEYAAHIWSSATLYNTEQQKLRQQWFNKWVCENPSACLYSLFHFHKNTGEGNPAIDLVMNRDDKLFTVSITGIAVNSSARLMQYIDLRNNDSTTIGFATEREYI